MLLRMPSRMDFDLDFGRPGRRRDEGAPLRMLVLGDFSGKPASERSPLASRATMRVDVDTFDKTMQRIGPKLRVPSGELDIHHVDDFHPDHLFRNLEIFQGLQRSRANPPAGNLAAEDIGRLLGKPAEVTASTAPPLSGIDAIIQQA